MASSFSGAFLLLLFLSFTASALGSVVRKGYTHITTHLTWQEAQSYCRRSNHYTDLATIFTQSDEDDITMVSYYAWIGLYKESNSWMWSNGEFFYLNSIWARMEPWWNEHCAVVSFNSPKLYGANCQSYYFFYCHEMRPQHLEYKFIPLSKNWSEAQAYCRSSFDDLATFRTSQDVDPGQQDFPVWIGLHKEGGTWKWSGASSPYRNWGSGSAENGGDCVSISSSDKKMASRSCSSRYPFVCYRDNVVLVKENKTWEEALEHCRALNRELISVQPGEDHDYLVTRAMEAVTEQVWTGLRFLAGDWLWIDGVTVSYPNLPLCPAPDRHCGVLSKNDTGSVEVADCSERRNFLCYSTW